jgi:acyl carrier protein
MVQRGRMAQIVNWKTFPLEWESLKHMQIVFAVEGKFGVRLTEEDLPRLDSLVGFAKHLGNSHAA